MADGAATTLLRREITSLRRRVADWTATRWSARAQPADLADAADHGGAPVPVTRADAAAALVRQLAELGRRAGSGAPPGMLPPRLGDHALADQLAVVGEDLLASPGVDAVAVEALDAVTRTRSALDGTPPPADVRALVTRPPAS